MSVIVSPSPNDRSKKAESSEWLQEAQRFVAEERLDEAGRVLEKAVAEYPESIEALSHLGYFYYQSGLYSRALKVFTQRLALGEPDIGLCKILADIQIRRGDYQDALQYLRLGRRLGNRERGYLRAILFSYIRLYLSAEKNHLIRFCKTNGLVLKLHKKYAAIANFLNLQLVRIFDKNNPNRPSGCEMQKFHLHNFLRFLIRYDPRSPQVAYSYHKNREAQVVSQALPLQKSHRLLLDIGTGNNILPLYWAAQGASVIMMDGSLYCMAHLRETQNRMRKDGVSFCTYLLTGDARRLPLRSECLDGISSICALEHVPGVGDIECMAEIHRVLKPGGRAAVTVETNRFRSEYWMEVPYERGYQVDGIADSSKPSAKPGWYEMFCRNYSPQDMIERLTCTGNWKILEYGFYDDPVFSFRSHLDSARHPLLAKILEPFQPIFSIWFYSPALKSDRLSPASIGYLILEKL